MRGRRLRALVIAWIPAGLALAGVSHAQACSSQELCAPHRGLCGADPARPATIEAPRLKPQVPELAGGGRQALVPGPATFTTPPWLARPRQEASTGHGYRYDWTVGPLDPDHDDQYAYRLPYGDGVSYPILQSYGSRLSHQGQEFFTLDFRMPEGTLVHAARDGVVVLVEESNDAGCWADGCGRLANYVVVLHRDGTTSEYFHLKKDGVLVEPGTRVSVGQPIAVSGNTGYTTTPHLHFGVYRAGSNGRTQSIGVRFLTRSGIVQELRPGARYLNASARSGRAGAVFP